MFLWLAELWIAPMQLSWLKLGVKLGPVFHGHPENAIVSWDPVGFSGPKG